MIWYIYKKLVQIQAEIFLYITHLKLLVFYYIFNESDASIKYEDVKTDSSGEYSFNTFISDINKNKFILQIFSNDYRITLFDITPYFYIFSIYQGKININDIIDKIVIKAYTMNVQNNYLKPVNNEIYIKIFYMIINA